MQYFESYATFWINIMSTDGNPKPGSCSYFVERKHRYCKLNVAAGKTFCGEHVNAQAKQKGECSTADANYVKPERVRIPCPLDPKHTLWADQLKHHLRKCNSRPKELPVYYIKGINRIVDTDTDVSTKVPLSSMAKEELQSIVDCVQTIYKAHITDLPDQVINHSVLEDELANPKNGVTARKHLCQVSSLLGHLERVDVLASKTCYVEFGAGRGQMTHWVQQAVQDQSDVSFILVDRATIRHKMDTKHRWTKDAPSFERLKIDIEHLCLGKVASISDSDVPLVAYSKHLCGAATDLTLHCLLETTQHEAKDESSAEGTKHDKRPRVHGIVIALCCHHQCDWTSYVGRDWWLSQGLTSKDFTAVSHMSSWATCGSVKKAGKVNASDSNLDTGSSSSENQGAGDRGGLDKKNLPENKTLFNDRISQLADNSKDEVENLVSTEVTSDGKLDSRRVASDHHESVEGSLGTDKSHKVPEHSKIEIQRASNNESDDSVLMEETSGDRTMNTRSLNKDVGSAERAAKSLMEASEERKPKISKVTRRGDVHSGGGDISAQRLLGLDISQREDIGRQCKRLIDFGRLKYLEGLGFKGHLVYYIDKELSLENVAMVAVPK